MTNPLTGRPYGLDWMGRISIFPPCHDYWTRIQIGPYFPDINLFPSESNEYCDMNAFIKSQPKRYTAAPGTYFFLEILPEDTYALVYRLEGPPGAELDGDGNIIWEVAGEGVYSFHVFITTRHIMDCYTFVVEVK
jgi:hypothetical protein